MKEWTILIYADGNNELEPEMYQSKLDMELAGSTENINVILQLGRENKTLVNLIRPEDDFPEQDEIWEGVRRYYVEQDKSLLINDLGKINMASPKNLYNFIKWGSENYPAKHYLLSLAGHGASFIAVMPDFSGDAPYMMGTIEMCKAINLADVKIDILLLDICYMNIIEMMYELGKKRDHLIHTVITYIRNGPLSGIPYSKVISTIKNSIAVKDTSIIVKNIINNMNLNLVGVEINYRKLYEIKKSLSKLSYLYLTSQYRISELSELFYNMDTNLPWHKQLLDLKSCMDKIIIHHKQISEFNGNLINITTAKPNNINEFMSIYYRLSFAKNNYWSYLLCNKRLGESMDYIMDMQFEPVIITKEGFKKLIQAMNPTYLETKINEILNKVYDYKKWNNPPS